MILNRNIAHDYMIIKTIHDMETLILEERPQISVIVPVYNAEKYIDRCVQSISDQSYTNWELLLIDDGSPDRSGTLCDEWKKRDSRIRVIHGPNCGVSVARNVGLDAAEGEWVMFVDSDDWIEKECLEVCVETANNSSLDLLQFNFKQIDSKGVLKAIYEKETPVMNSKDFITHGVYNVSAWGCLIRKSIIRDNYIRFVEGIKLAEDQLFIMECLAHSEKIQLIKHSFYCYFLNENSAVHNARSQDILNSCNSLIKFKERYPIFKEHIDHQINSFCTTLLYNGDVPTNQILQMFDGSNIKTVSNADIFGRMLLLGSKFQSRVVFWFTGFLLRIKFGIRGLVIRFK